MTLLGLGHRDIVNVGPILLFSPLIKTHSPLIKMSTPVITLDYSVKNKEQDTQEPNQLY